MGWRCVVEDDGWGWSFFWIVEYLVFVFFLGLGEIVGWVGGDKVDWVC